MSRQEVKAPGGSGASCSHGEPRSSPLAGDESARL